ncbi:UNVERIFIED_CONTAM: hypothetical protein FKN15_038917 [Acipenser sinensis]
MSKLSKMASSSSQLGTFAPMWDLFRVSSDKLALCHLELTRKLSDLIREINKYGDEQVKVHRKTKEEVTGTLEAVQSMQVSSSHLHKARESYLSRCLEHERLRKEGANQKEVEKAEAKSKKAAEMFSACVEKYNRVGGDFERKMSESAQKFQEIEEAHLRQMKVLIKSYSHSIEDTHVQVGQVHEEFKQNVENIGVDNLIQKFSDQKGTGRDRPGSTTAAACIAAHHARAPGNEHDGYRRCASSPVPNRLISAALPPEPLFGPPLESAFKHSGFTAPVSGGSTPPHLAPPAPHEVGVSDMSPLRTAVYMHCSIHALLWRTES